MKIVAINGSPTGMKGTTGKALQAVADGARGSGAEVELFELGSLTVGPCISCHTCQKTGRCVIKDDYPAVRDALIAADGMLLATPNYISNVSAQLKALLDRSFSTIFHCQALHGKYAAVVVASGGPQYSQVEEYLLHISGSMGCWKVGSFVAGGGQFDDPATGPAARAEARDLGRQLAEAVGSRKAFPEQEDERQLTFETMRWLVEQNRDEWPYEYEYWNTRWKGE